MKLIESIVLAAVIIITSIGVLFTLIGLTTPNWSRTGYGLWDCNHVCSKPTAIFAILALICLVISIIILVTLFLRIFPEKLRPLPLGLLIIASFFLLSSTGSYLRRFRLVGYSFELIDTAHAFAFLASVLLAFWFGITMNERVATNTMRSTTSSSSSTIGFSSA
ncbi:unnamed protein product [Rotaria sp. Silwood1]|nr:unnamed protein product [Rotaria sp. Silwood1]CAF1058949.1 unnamed protein product [Rotaria sp. Silwood1]CAF3416821.1 unnamed protein product [Rotaria sp. Silwood1]CAF3434543.1 unnamed protein product [Rotaria sp. Silwood1]CAF4545058.1 unnamed protein product [Rotaria sp. Silwood1]